MDYLQYLLYPAELQIHIEWVLNLIINGLPSIPMRNKMTKTDRMGFKPYYKWITFNTAMGKTAFALNLLSFKPYYKWITFNTQGGYNPSKSSYIGGFKPYYKWITFNT